MTGVCVRPVDSKKREHQEGGGWNILAADMPQSPPFFFYSFGPLLPMKNLTFGSEIIEVYFSLV